MPNPNFKGYGTKRYIPPETMRVQGTDLRFTILDIVRFIVLDSSAVFQDPTNNNLFAWGARIETLDSFINTYYQSDDEYQIKRRDYKMRILAINPYDKSLPTRLKIKRIYDDWFSLLGNKLAKFKIYPPISTSFVQGVGEYG